MMVNVLKAAAFLALVFISACQSDSPETGSIFASNDVFGDLNPRKPKSNVREEGYAVGRSGASGGMPVTQNYRPEAGITTIQGRTENGPAQYALNFQGSDIKDVIRGILTDALQLNYTINGTLAGPVTVASATPVSRETLLKTLESSLSAFGYSMYKEGDGYRIGPNGLSGGQVDRGTAVTAGYGLSVVPLSFVPASTMLQLLSGFVAETDSLRISGSGNVIVVRGTAPHRAEVVQAIGAFDADFMADQSVSIFRLVQARPEALIPELDRIFQADADSGLIQFRPMSRLRGILAISKNPTLIRRAEKWVRRLDQEDGDTGQNVLVYKAKYRKAAELAKVISTLFSGGGGSDGPSTVPEAPDPEAAMEGDQQSTDGAPSTDQRVASAFKDPSVQGAGAGVGGVVGPNVIDLTQQGQGGGSGVRVSADPSNNSVVIYADSERGAEIMATLRRLDSTPAQVAINVTIAEVRLTKELKFGVQYFVNSKRLGLGSDNGSISVVDNAAGVLQSQIPGLNLVLGSIDNPDVIISALDVISDVEVLSSPSLVVVENQTASLQVGDEVPITTRQSQSTENSLAPIINQVEFKNTGILLNVTPRIGQNDAVTMDIAQEISNVVGGSDTLTPTISKRRVESQISVADGQTVLLAGLISAGRDNSKNGIPGFRKLGFVDKLFGRTEKANTRTELIVLIRPVVIRDEQDAGNVAAGLRANMQILDSRRSPFK